MVDREVFPMASNAKFAAVASLVGDPARAGMLHALMDGRALTAKELARVAGVTPQTASSHLAQMSEIGLLGVEKQGRHRYHRLASQAVAQMIESIMQVASLLEEPQRRLSVGPRDAALRQARTCYDHLAGRLGVALADAMVSGGYAELANDAGVMTESGMALLGRIGIDLDALTTCHKRAQRVLCRPCLDWSERRAHLAGSVGAAICTHSLEHGWVRRIPDTRAVAITPKGLRVFREQFGAEVGWLGTTS
jgi:DNA-binding transcriptional ArsR family regulator